MVNKKQLEYDLVARLDAHARTTDNMVVELHNKIHEQNPQADEEIETNPEGILAQFHKQFHEFLERKKEQMKNE